MASKCVSQPDETKVKTAINSVFNITLPEVFFISLLKIFHQKIQNVTKNDTLSILHQRSLSMRNQKITVEPSALLNAFGSITSSGQCSFSQLDENKKDLVESINLKLKSLPRFNYSSYTIFNRQQCEGMIRFFNRAI